MPRIYVEFIQLNQLRNKCKSISKEISQISADFQGTIRKLDWDVRFQNNINNTANTLAKKMETEIDALRAYERFLKDAYKEYLKLDQEKVDLNLLNIDSIISTEAAPSNESEKDKQFLSIIKSTLKWADETDSDPNPGIINDGLSYIESLLQFFTGDKTGLTGAKDWFDLGDNSISLWAEFYDYLKDFYNGAGNTFSLSNQEKVAELRVVAGTFGLISSIFGAADIIGNTENIGTAGITSEILEGGSNVVDIWGGIEKLKHVGDTATNITTRDGVYSPLSFYTTIAKGYISSIAQGFSSYEKYSADGKWDLGDTGATGIESAVSGLYSMIQSLTFGLVSDKTTGVSSEEISAGLENWASDIGDRAGNYIVHNSDLNNVYQNSNAIGKAVITFYAAFASI